MPKPKLKFYCVRLKERFSSSNYRVKKKTTRKRTTYLAIASHKGYSCPRIVSKDFYMMYKGK